MLAQRLYACHTLPKHCTARYSYPSWPGPGLFACCCAAVIAQGLFGWGREPATAEAVNETFEPTSATEAPAVLPPTIDIQPMMGAYTAEPPQSLIDEQLAHMIDPELDEFVEEVIDPRMTLCFC
jgi:hypothetical protein